VRAESNEGETMRDEVIHSSGPEYANNSNIAVASDFMQPRRQSY